VLLAWVFGPGTGVGNHIRFDQLTLFLPVRRDHNGRIAYPDRPSVYRHYFETRHLAAVTNSAHLPVRSERRPINALAGPRRATRTVTAGRGKVRRVPDTRPSARSRLRLRRRGLYDNLLLAVLGVQLLTEPYYNLVSFAVLWSLKPDAPRLLAT
jgi:hypothetical protein